MMKSMSNRHQFDDFDVESISIPLSFLTGKQTDGRKYSTIIFNNLRYIIMYLYLCMCLYFFSKKGEGKEMVIILRLKRGKFINYRQLNIWKSLSVPLCLFISNFCFFYICIISDIILL